MAQDPQAKPEPQEEELIEVLVPAHLIDKVLAYVAELTTSEDEGEVGGYLMLRGIGGSTGPTRPDPPITGGQRGDHPLTEP